jgi:structural maintenance of chromosome 2
MNTAKKVTFDDRIMKKSVTLEGDSFDPAGTLTGGRKIRLYVRYPFLPVIKE